MEKIDREIKEKEAQWRRLKSEAIRKKKKGEGPQNKDCCSSSRQSGYGAA